MINSNIKWQWLIPCLLCWVSTHAQESYTLDGCLQMALKSNLQIRIASNDIQKVIQQIAETRSALLPQISGEYQFSYNPDLPPAFLPGFIVGQPQVENVPAILGLKQTQYAGVSASQQLFNPRLFIALKALKTATQLTELQLLQTREDVVYNVYATFYNLLTLYKQMDLLEVNIKSFETTINTTETLQKNDFAKKSDVNRLILAKKGIETQLINLQVAEHTLLNVLRLLTDTPEESPFGIVTELSTETETIGSLEAYPENRTEYKILQTSAMLKELERKTIQASHIPVLVLFGGYFSYAYNADFNPFKRAESRSFDVSQVGLSLKIPVFDGGAKRAKSTQKSLEIESIKNQQQLLTQQIRNDIKNTANKYNSSITILQMEEENIALAQVTLEEIKTNYRNGFVGVTDVINAENDLQKTQTNYLTALINVRLAVLEWKKATGTLLIF
ncbi:MAG TPA: TolC family protein [Saprospiraceae bacterium]|nr:TolC family protein [Saprospiraceae bacterium]HMP22680.1 TolC family protein [Saprospiraceae bacterium]